MLADAAPTPVLAPAARLTTVRLGEYSFKPKRLTVRLGGRVRFVNVGRIDHTVADVDSRGRIRSKVIRPRALGHGDAQTVTFRRRGTIRYVCTLHPTLMGGTIVVKG